MRKLVLLAGLLLAAAVIPNAPAQAQAMLGCQCVSVTAAPACVATVLECNINKAGVCVAPCSYEPPKKMARKHKGKKKKSM